MDFELLKQVNRAINFAIKSGVCMADRCAKVELQQLSLVCHLLSGFFFLCHFRVQGANRGKSRESVSPFTQSAIGSARFKLISFLQRHLSSEPAEPHVGYAVVRGDVSHCLKCQPGYRALAKPRRTLGGTLSRSLHPSSALLRVVCLCRADVLRLQTRFCALVIHAGASVFTCSAFTIN